MSDIMRLHQIGQNIPTAEEVNSSFQPLLERHERKRARDASGHSRYSSNSSRYDRDF